MQKCWNVVIPHVKFFSLSWVELISQMFCTTVTLCSIFVFGFSAPAAKNGGKGGQENCQNAGGVLVLLAIEPR
jgi:hypothetical protein